MTKLYLKARNPQQVVTIVSFPLRISFLKINLEINIYVVYEDNVHV